MTRKDRPPGGDSRGPEDQSPPRRRSVVIVGHGADAGRFGQPSNYSLSPAELTAEVRRRRRDGWQHWEINTRFTFDGCRNVA
jgi:hypothetical protein